MKAYGVLLIANLGHCFGGAFVGLGLLLLLEDGAEYSIVLGEKAGFASIGRGLGFLKRLDFEGLHERWGRKLWEKLGKKLFFFLPSRGIELLTSNFLATKRSNA
jgi:hypothetical protein